ncbi:hypothetical protein CENSYa_1034 [Cenarchaeum symbiosum A]|uniref:Uncharacterized protein n=1 Tax=Cenarchaeum symbiosum (strain A) TaxID=414004 RepID=A0RWE8_CENSY|nr:hypothetical protein CENSYa_1034 [Cenarchaeum symbiosum A]
MTVPLRAGIHHAYASGQFWALAGAYPARNSTGPAPGSGPLRPYCGTSRGPCPSLSAWTCCARRDRPQWQAGTPPITGSMRGQGAPDAGMHGQESTRMQALCAGDPCIRPILTSQRSRIF